MIISFPFSGVKLACTPPCWWCLVGVSAEDADAQEETAEDAICFYYAARYEFYRTLLFITSFWICKLIIFLPRLLYSQYTDTASVTKWNLISLQPLSYVYLRHDMMRRYVLIYLGCLYWFNWYIGLSLSVKFKLSGDLLFFKSKANWLDKVHSSSAYKFSLSFLWDVSGCELCKKNYCLYKWKLCDFRLFFFACGLLRQSLIAQLSTLHTLLLANNVKWIV